MLNKVQIAKALQISPEQMIPLTKEIMVFKAHAFHVEQKQEQETFHVRCSMSEEQ